MYARAIDEAETRLLELRHEERYQLGLSALALAASLAMTTIYAPVVLPLFVAGLAVGMLGMRTFWQRWDIVDRLADERDAYVIPEVLSYAERDVCMERRSNSAALVRSWLLDGRRRGQLADPGPGRGARGARVRARRPRPRARPRMCRCLQAIPDRRHGQPALR